MKRKCIDCIIIFVMLFGIIITLTGCNTKKKSNNENMLIGSWMSDWRTTQDLNIFFFKEDGTGEELIITKENIKNVKDIEYLESIAESVMNFTYIDYGDYFDMVYIYEGEEVPIRVDYKIENNILKVDIDQAGWTHREYDRM